MVKNKIKDQLQYLIIDRLFINKLKNKSDSMSQYSKIIHSKIFKMNFNKITLLDKIKKKIVQIKNKQKDLIIFIKPKAKH